MKTQCKAGTELAAILARLGFKSDENCRCRSHAREMDAKGCEWCEQNIETIVGWLREQASIRGVPFIDAFGRQLVLYAIRKATKPAIDRP